MNLEQAVATLRAGGLVAFPTETVYGLGADASNPEAVLRIFEAKQRPPGRPISILVSPSLDLHRYCHWTPQAQALADRFWPGPLTLILPRTEAVPDVVTGGAQSVGLRMPDHAVALALLEAFGGGLATPSANRSGGLSPTSADHVREDLGEAVDVILDGGTCSLGVESTVLDLSQDPPAILRMGALGAEAIAAVLGVEPSVTGQQAPHYRPRTKKRVCLPQAILASPPGDEVGVLWRGALPPEAGPNWMALPDEPAAYGRAFFASLRALDSAGYTELWLADVPQTAAWAAVYERVHG